MTRRLRRLLLGAASMTIGSLAGCTGNESSEPATERPATVTDDFGGNESSTGESNSSSTSTPESEDIDVGPRTGDSPPSESPNSDITRISFTGTTLHTHIANEAEVNAVAVVSPMGSRLALREITEGNESIRFDLVSETHGMLYPPGEYSIHGYKAEGSNNSKSYEKIETHSVNIEPDLSISGVENIGVPGRVRLRIVNEGTGPLPVSEYRVSRFWRTAARGQWTEPEQSPRIVQPDQTESIVVETKTQRFIESEREYEQLQEEFCNGETMYRSFEFRTSPLMTLRESVTKELVLEGEAIQETQESGATVYCNQISENSEEDDE